jgi:NTP pyrophosphatase (non-canonical NTP hydrolase)
MDYNQLEALVVAWADEKGILAKATTLKQAEKTMEEVQELIDAIKNDDQEEIEDALGDILVTIIIQAKMQNMSLIECLEISYNIIAKRTGKMIDGQFKKDA